MSYCKPLNAGKDSEAKKVGQYIAKALDALDYINSNRVVDAKDSIISDVYHFKYQVRKKLQEEGWRIKVNAKGNSWQVLPPI